MLARYVLYLQSFGLLGYISFYSKTDHSDLLNFPDRLPSRSALIFVVISLQLLAIELPFYVSDDAIRHIHDGHYLLENIDVYQVVPLDLPPVLEQLPNHPGLGTIYLPLTQMLAMGGAYLHTELGYLILFHLLAILLVLQISRSKRASSVRSMLLLCCMPAVVYATSGHHADLLGMLIVFVNLFYEPRRGQPVAFLRHAILCALLPGLKPIGLVWMLYFLGRAIWRARVLDRLAYLAGLLFCAAGQFLFAYTILMKDAHTLPAMAQTGRIFTDWFVAYNPVVDLMHWWGSSRSTPQILHDWRLLVLVSGVVLLLFRMAFFYRKNYKSYQLVALSARGRGRFLIQILRAGVSIGLLMAILQGGAWHVWYFVWLMPVLLWYRNPGWWALLALPPLAYLPVVELRAGSVQTGWSMQGFYVASGVFLLALIGLTCQKIIGSSGK